MDHEQNSDRRPAGAPAHRIPGAHAAPWYRPPLGAPLLVTLIAATLLGWLLLAPPSFRVEGVGSTVECRPLVAFAGAVALHEPTSSMAIRSAALGAATENGAPAPDTQEDLHRWHEQAERIAAAECARLHDQRLALTVVTTRMLVVAVTLLAARRPMRPRSTE